ncbi:MAG: prephenate dehydrogenase [Myxococcota bacterium]
MNNADASSREISGDGPGASLRPQARDIVVVGLGLIGGSIARATKRAWPKARITGIDRAVIVEVAREEGIIDAGGSPESATDALAAADLVVLALPVLGIVEALETFRAPLAERAVITDTGSTKGAILAAAEALELRRFVGGHPMTGKPAGGLAQSDPDLLVGASWFLSTHASSNPESVGFLRRWVAELGARPLEIDAAEHDHAVALTSHLPHIVANALAESVLESGAMDAAGGSLRDLLRVAGAPFNTWGDTLATNQTAVTEALGELIERLSRLKDQLHDRDRLRDLFARGRACKERVGTKG